MSGKPGRSGRKRGSVAPGLVERNRSIIAAHKAGQTIRQLAGVFKLHPSRIGQIVKRGGSD